MDTIFSAQRSGSWERAFASALVDQMPSLRAYARRLTSGAADWDDLVQDTLLRCWTARDGFTLGSNLVGWTRTVMRNRFFSERRRAHGHVDLPNDAISDMLSVGESQSAVIELGDILRALEELAPIYRQAVELMADGVTVTEGALRLGITKATLKSRVFRGRLRLRQLVEERATPALHHKRNAVSAPRPAVRPRKRDHWKGVMIG